MTTAPQLSYQYKIKVVLNIEFVGLKRSGGVKFKSTHVANNLFLWLIYFNWYPLKKIKAFEDYNIIIQIYYPCDSYCKHYILDMIVLLVYCSDTMTRLRSEINAVLNSSFNLC